MKNFAKEALPRIEDLEDKIAKFRSGDMSLETNNTDVSGEADARIAGKLNTYMRKLEMKLEDKVDRTETLSEFKTYREQLDLLNTTMTSFKAQIDADNEESCTQQERDKWNDNLK